VNNQTFNSFGRSQSSGKNSSNTSPEVQKKIPGHCYACWAKGHYANDPVCPKFISKVSDDKHKNDQIKPSAEKKKVADSKKPGNQTVVKTSGIVI